MKNKMKSLLASILVGAMIFTSSSVTAFAEKPENPDNEQTNETINNESEINEVEEDSNDEIATASVITGTKPANGTTQGQPFPAGTAGSQMFRIPAMVTLSNGAIVAATDARWNNSGDGGGLDTIVSYSTDQGTNWNYTFANYLGDNDNTYNPESTAFIDPALATDGQTVYMLVDLFPAGYAINSAAHTPKVGQIGFTDDGNLKLTNDVSSDNNNRDKSYNYYLKDGKIYDTNNQEVSGYTVDDKFNITGNGISTNLFCSDSPYQVYPTNYLYLTSSTDGGANWSAPTLINVKHASEQTCLVGPGKGIVTSSGRIIYPVYEYTNGTQHTSVIYSDDQGKTWKRSANMDRGTSEATITEADGKLYMFTRGARGYYVSTDNGATWGTRQKVTDISYYTGCQMNAITYSKKIDGKTAILLSAGTNARNNGKIFVGLVQGDGSITWKYKYAVNTGTYQYSCLSELKDGTVALLYEDGTASEKFVKYSIEDIAKDATIENGKEEIKHVATSGATDSVTATIVTNNANDELAFSKCKKKATSTEVDGYNCSVTYDMELSLNGKKYTDSAEIAIPYDADVFAGCERFTGYVGGSTSGEAQKFDVTLKDGKFVGTCPHFSEVTIAGYKPDVAEEIEKTVNVSLIVGQTSEGYKQSGEYTGNYSNNNVDVKTEVTDVDSTPYYEAANLSAATFYASTQAGDSSPAAKLTFEDAGNGQYYVKNASGTDVYPDASYDAWRGWSYNIQSNEKKPVKVEKNADGSVILSREVTDSYWTFSGRKTVTTTVYMAINNSTISSSGNSTNIYLYNQVIPEAGKQTTVTFTGKTAGTTSVVIGNTQYNITVNEKPGNVTFDNTAFIKKQTSKKITKLTISPDLSYELGLNITGNVTWWIEDTNIATVDKNGKVTAKQEGETTLFASVDGNTYALPVVVKKYATTSKVKTYNFYISENTDTTTYYGVLNGSSNNNVTAADLTKIQQGEVVYLSFDQSAGTAVDFFAAPNDGYALTQMSASHAAGHYKALNSTNPAETDFITTNNVAGNIQANAYGTTAVYQLVQSALNVNCDGAMGFTRQSSQKDSVESDLTFRSEKLPTVNKEVDHLEATDGKEIPYKEGIVAKKGDKVVFKITVNKYACQKDNTITYTDAKLVDNLQGAVFEGTDSGTKKITIPGDTKSRSQVFYVDYTVKETDLDTSIVNTVDLSYNYKAQYSSGTFSKSANAEAKVTATAFEGIKDIVIDYGLPVKIQTKGWGRCDRKVTIKKATAEYGDVVVTGDNVAGLTLTYTPNKVLTGVDTVTLTNNHDGTYSFKVYPANTVYYEEGFAIDGASKGSTKNQTTSAVGDGELYGYDAAYNDINSGDNANITNTTANVTADGTTAFTFNGTGCDIYAKTTSTSGAMSMWLYDETGKLLKLGYVDTHQEWLENSRKLDFYNTPVFRYSGLTAGTYKVVMKAAKGTVALDGFRVYNTQGASYDSIYAQDKENNVQAVDFRDITIAQAAINMDEIQDNYKYGDTIIKAVYDATNNGTGAVILDPSGTTTEVTTDMVNNGPKFELYLKPKQAIALSVNGQAEKVAIGMRSLNGGAISYKINGNTESNTVVASTADMYYDVKQQLNSGKLVIQNTGANVIALTKIRATQFVAGTQEENQTLADAIDTNADTIAYALECISEKVIPDTADATADLNLVDYTGKTIASTSLTANGEQGTDATFTADQIKSAVTSALPEGYAVVDASKIADQTVKYGESADVNVQIGKVATLKVTYKKLFGKTVGTATLTGVQTSAGSKYSFSASEIKKAVPSGYWTIKLWGTKVKYGTTGTLTVNVF